jgi:hypothetical protein
VPETESPTGITADPVVMLIDGDRIFFSDYLRELQKLIGGTITIESITQDDYNVFEKECFNLLIANHLLLKETERRNIEIEEEELISGLIRFSRAFAEHEFEQYLTNQNLTYIQFKEIYRNELKIKKLIQLIENEAPTPTPDEMKNYFRDNQSEFTIPTMVKFTQFECSDPEDAKWIHEKFRREEMYDLLEDEYKDRKDNLVMGRWGEVSLDALPKEFAKVIEKLEPGQISDLITYEKLEKKEDGTLTREKKHFFFELEYKISAKNLRFSDVENIIRDRLIEQSKKHQLEQWLQDQKSKAMIRYFPENINRENVLARIKALYPGRINDYEPMDTENSDEKQGN